MKALLIALLITLLIITLVTGAFLLALQPVGRWPAQTSRRR